MDDVILAHELRQLDVAIIERSKRVDPRTLVGSDVACRHDSLDTCRGMRADELELNEVKEESVKVAVRKHESALISEQSKLVDLQTLLDSREEASHHLAKCVSYPRQVSKLIWQRDASQQPPLQLHAPLHSFGFDLIRNYGTMKSPYHVGIC